MKQYEHNDTSQPLVYSKVPTISCTRGRQHEMGRFQVKTTIGLKIRHRGAEI